VTSESIKERTNVKVDGYIFTIKLLCYIEFNVRLTYILGNIQTNLKQIP